MVSPGLSESLPQEVSVKKEWREGWRVLLSAHVGIASGATLSFFTSSLFVVPLSEAFNWSRGEIASAEAFGLLGGLSAPIIGRIADRFGTRPVAMTCCILLSLIVFAKSQMTGSFTQFMFLSAAFGLVAPGSTGLIFSRAVTSWFVAARGQALGIMAAGVSVGALILTPLVAFMISKYGFSGGYLTISAVALFVGLPAIVLGVRDKAKAPADIHLRATADVSEEKAPESAPKPKIIDAIRTRGFWGLALAVIAINGPGAGVLTQLDPILLNSGVDSRAVLIAMFAVVVFIGRIGIGWLFDKLDARIVAAVVTIGGALGCFLFLSGSPFWLVVLAVVLLGLLQGMETDLIGYFVARPFHRQLYGTLYGVLFAVSLLGTGIGIVAFGMLYDKTQSYNLALIIAAFILIIPLVGYLIIPRSSKISPAN